MKWLTPFLALTLGAAAPLRIISVERQGLPPYEGTERLYRLEGEGCDLLKPGMALLLRRTGNASALGRLQVLSVHAGYALTRLAEPGATFPLKGDLALRTDRAESLPALPVVSDPPPLASAGLEPLRVLRGIPVTPLPVLPAPGGTADPSLAGLQPRTLSLPQAAPAPVHAAEVVTSVFVPPPVVAVPSPSIHREIIFFLKGNASLSPGGQGKLKAWAGAWGREGRWYIEDPDTSTFLAQERFAALREALAGLGVRQVEPRSCPPSPPGPYDVVYVVKEP